MRRKEQTLVISQKVYIYKRLLETTNPNMAERKRNRTKKKNSFCHEHHDVPFERPPCTPEKNGDQAADNTGDKNHDQGKVVNNDIGIIIKRPMADIFKP